MTTSESRPGTAPAWGLLLAVAGAKLAVHLALANRYGYFRDELYFLDCGRNLAWGYVDAAPAVGLYAKVALLLGGSLPVLRGIAGLAGAAVVLLTGLLAWRLGGSRAAQGLAAVAALATPIFLAIAGLFSMNVFEPLFWTGCAYVLVRLADGASPRLWLLFGLLAASASSTSTPRPSSASLSSPGSSSRRCAARSRRRGPGRAQASRFSSSSRIFSGRRPTASRPSKTFATSRAPGRTSSSAPASSSWRRSFSRGRTSSRSGSAASPGSSSPERAVTARSGAAFAVFFVLMFAMKAKAYYLTPAFPMLLAAGAVGLDELFERRRRLAGRVWPRAAVSAWAVLLTVPVAPLVLPILDPPAFVAYTRRIGFEPPRSEVAHRGPLPQMFGDQFGWPELVADVAKVWNGLTPEERARAAIFANNYGEAGAINLFGPAHGLPRAISAHQNHFFWGPPAFTGDVLVVLQDDRESLERLCTSVEEAGRHQHPWGMAEENGPIWVCRGLKTPLAELWPRLKKWN